MDTKKTGLFAILATVPLCALLPGGVLAIYLSLTTWTPGTGALVVLGLIAAALAYPVARLYIGLIRKIDTPDTQQDLEETIGIDLLLLANLFIGAAIIAVPLGLVALLNTPVATQGNAVLPPTATFAFWQALFTLLLSAAFSGAYWLDTSASRLPAFSGLAGALVWLSGAIATVGFAVLSLVDWL